MIRKEVRGFFFEKKKQKTFGPAGCGTASANARRTRSFFGYFFFKKSNFLLPSGSRLEVDAGVDDCVEDVAG
jgi:hypothetical protein